MSRIASAIIGNEKLLDITFDCLPFVNGETAMELSSARLIIYNIIICEYIFITFFLFHSTFKILTEEQLYLSLQKPNTS